RHRQVNLILDLPILGGDHVDHTVGIVGNIDLIGSGSGYGPAGIADAIDVRNEATPRGIEDVHRACTIMGDDQKVLSQSQSVKAGASGDVEHRNLTQLLAPCNAGEKQK